MTILLTIFASFAYIAMISSSVRALSPSVRILRSMGISAFAAQLIYVVEIELVSLLCQTFVR